MFQTAVRRFGASALRSASMQVTSHPGGKGIGISKAQGIMKAGFIDGEMKVEAFSFQKAADNVTQPLAIPL